MRTNIELDDQLVKQALQISNLKTKRGCGARSTETIRCFVEAEETAIASRRRDLEDDVADGR